MIKQFVPDLKFAHFLSDSPSTQYRNRNMFFLIGTYLAKQLGVDRLMWHYSESGHGKGAPDGVGGCLKRTADSLVNQSKDITNCQSFIDNLEQHCPNIKLMKIDVEQMDVIDKIIPDKQTFPPVKGTMSIHQITWFKQEAQVLQARKLSCLKKHCKNQKCKHYHVATVHIPKESSKKTSDPKKPRKQLHYKDVYTSDEMSDEEPPTLGDDLPTIGKNDIVIGDWVAVVYDDLWYPGIIERKMDENVEITFMKRNGKVLHWPSTPDKQTVAIHTILCKILEPPLPTSSRQFKLPSQEFQRIDQTFNNVF
ncbi:uncharacterized protein LOC128986031 [Macrosteles quadrilineatus]|uniref:uncharacterized protein LOC128986031 n=1 Tax=Macrosteles quadrilineatus TaxID=74068 RepID=UPI0023E1F783|nr:uncharacterized protein LOC128986031 [Macrosteles quadrilineatus]